MQPAAGEVSGRNRKMQGACREYTEYLESMSLKERNRKPGVEKVDPDLGTPREIIRPNQFQRLNSLRHKHFAPLLFLPAFALTGHPKSDTISTEE